MYINIQHGGKAITGNACWVLPGGPLIPGPPNAPVRPRSPSEKSGPSTPGSPGGPGHTAHNNTTQIQSTNCSDYYSDIDQLIYCQISCHKCSMSK